MLKIEPITNNFIHLIANASKGGPTLEMAYFLAALPTDDNAATEDAIEDFDGILDNMEEEKEDKRLQWLD